MNSSFFTQIHTSITQVAWKSQSAIPSMFPSTGSFGVRTITGSKMRDDALKHKRKFEKRNERRLKDFKQASSNKIELKAESRLAFTLKKEETRLATQQAWAEWGVFKREELKKKAIEDQIKKEQAAKLKAEKEQKEKEKKAAAAAAKLEKEKNAQAAAPKS